MSSVPTVAIVGRVNVGKSTLFNRIAGGRVAIVDDQPGVTRDRKMTWAHWSGYDFLVIDTGGLDPGSEDAFQESIEKQINLAITEADAVILVVDATSSIHPFDIEAAKLVRKSGLPSFLAVNKVDNNQRMDLVPEFYSLGLDTPWPVSALHGHGSGDLLDAVISVLPQSEKTEYEGLSLAVVGRPNVGKSSTVNRLCREERNIVTEVPGTTRDSIDTMVSWHDNEIRIVDTAGLRRKSRKMDDVEFYSTVRAWKSIARGDIVLVLMDASEYPVQQDIRIAAKAWDMGKGVVIGVNKIDLGIDKDLWIASIIQRFNQAKDIPIIFFSALTGEGVGRILPIVFEVGRKRELNLSTSEINRRLQDAVEDVQPPSPRGKPVKLFYATQVGQKPPRILIFSNHPADIPDNYRRYIENYLMSCLALKGVPLKIIYRKRKH
ncbi:MAG: ribosome biogenesis GTPase Der [Candidatus Aegiribacteria sp.]|nr:ribosome biogenesis GTPase Der [Candidatus Aegiribacteria sp.]